MVLRLKMPMFFAVAALLLSASQAQTMPLINVTNSNDSWLQVIPLDTAHRDQIPQSAFDLLPDLPPGSFLVKNLTATPITVIVAKWVYTNTDGSSLQRDIHCDAYLLFHVDPLVNPNDSALITPDGCARQEYLAHLRNSSFFGSPLQSARNKAIVAAKESMAHVQISIDSIIFADGQIWGPDNSRYYRAIMQRHAARQALADDLTAAKSAGQDIISRLQKIEADARSNKDASSANKIHYARLIQSSPHPERTLYWLQHQDPLPDFRHIGGQE